MENKPLILLATLSLLLCAGYSKAQLNILPPNGNVGINDANPKSTLSINGNLSFTENYPYIRTIRGRADSIGKQNMGLEIYSSYNGSDGASLILLSKAAKNNAGSAEIWSNGQQDGQAFRIQRRVADDSLTFLLSLKNNGRLGIGDDNPDEILSINGNIAFSKNYEHIRTIRGRSDTTGLQNTGMEIYSSYNGSDGSALLLFSNASQYHPGSAEIWSVGADNNQAFNVMRRVNKDSSASLLRVENNGKVIIGNNVNSNTGYNYGLYVERGVLTEKLRVANRKDPVNWADFVFKKDYSLISLYELEAYVQKHCHLPEIPTAEEVAKDGIDVVSMDAKLLQKVEELTLYVIQLQKEIDSLKKDRKVSTKK